MEILRLKQAIITLQGTALLIESIKPSEGIPNPDDPEGPLIAGPVYSEEDRLLGLFFSSCDHCDQTVFRLFFSPLCYHRSRPRHFFRKTSCSIQGRHGQSPQQCRVLIWVLIDIWNEHYFELAKVSQQSKKAGSIDIHACTLLYNPISLISVMAWKASARYNLFLFLIIITLQSPLRISEAVFKCEVQAPCESLGKVCSLFCWKVSVVIWASHRFKKRLNFLINPWKLSIFLVFFEPKWSTSCNRIVIFDTHVSLFTGTCSACPETRKGALRRHPWRKWRVCGHCSVAGLQLPRFRTAWV